MLLHRQVRWYARCCPVQGTSMGPSHHSITNSRPKSEAVCLYLDENNRWGPFRLGGLDNVHVDHLLLFLLFEFSRLRPNVICGWMWWSVIRLFEFDSVLYCLSWAGYPFRILSNYGSMLIILWRYEEFSAESINFSHQLVSEISSDIFTALLRSTCSSKHSVVL